MEGAPQQENNTEQLSAWREHQEAGPKDAETFLSREGIELPCHEESISSLDDEVVLHEIVAEVNEEEARLEKILSDKNASEEDIAQANSQRYKMRHLGYLREVAKRRLAQLELRVAA